MYAFNIIFGKVQGLKLITGTEYRACVTFGHLLVLVLINFLARFV